ncbi:Hsp70 family protein [Peribacillus kribbensis]|uniref:Hsp70 family protein n=1 Tax=Peribacillus kribbensis TaxID=356658 RepID=UPI000404EADF|nr:Hsp70 family protein [Peribacillus kribbensis]
MLTVGIDLGTTNSACCTLIDGRYEFISFGREEVLPSVFLYQSGKKAFGSIAKRKSVVYATNYISSSKTYMGDLEKAWNIDGEIFTPTDVATELLSHIYKNVQKHFGVDDSAEIEAVITVPAYFTSNQIDETKKAGERAGFKVKRIVTEPVAAAIAYGHEIMGSDEQLFIFDLGGGTFDVSLLTVKGTGASRSYVTNQIGGDKKLGGDDFDDVLLGMIFSELRKTQGINLASQAQSGLDASLYANLRQKLLQAAEAAKKELSQSDSANIVVANLYEKDGVQHSLDMIVTRDQFGSKSEELIDRIEREVKMLLNRSETSIDRISRVILVGGSSQLPFVKEFIKNYFKKNPYSDIDLSKIVAMGAAQLAYNTAHGLGDVVQDMISHSLGIEVTGEEFEPILLKGSYYPTKETKEFTTVMNNQTSIAINVFEGENTEDVNQNECYGGFTLDNIERAPKGVPRIEVTFEFDESRILTVTATDKKTGSSKTVVMEKGKPIEKPTAKPVHVYFVIDTTGSMAPYIEGVKQTCHAFANEVQRSGANLKLGLLVYGDECYGEQPVLYGLTQNIDQFKREVTNCPRYYGGDEPETTFEAIMLCAKTFKKSNEDVNRVAIVVTDASAHTSAGKGKYSADEVLKELKGAEMTTFVVSPNYNYYRNFATSTGGKHYLISEYHRFVEVINEIAEEVASLVAV